jgi:trans-aconitate 2-methyltransferase
MPWDPNQYHKFQAERSAPFFDLLRLVEVRPNLKVVDLGCGTGELTQKLVNALPNSDVTGIDSSRRCCKRPPSLVRPGLGFEQGDQSQLTGEWDLIFSNAALQWSEYHSELIPASLSEADAGRSDRCTSAVKS